MRSGLEIIFTSPGAYRSMYCPLCMSKMNVTRQNGATTFTEAMARRQHIHDAWTCPHVKEDWHVQILKIHEDMEKTSSPSLINIMKKDIAKIIKKRKVI